MRRARNRRPSAASPRSALPRTIGDRHAVRSTSMGYRPAALRSTPLQLPRQRWNLLHSSSCSCKELEVEQGPLALHFAPVCSSHYYGHWSRLHSASHTCTNSLGRRCSSKPSTTIKLPAANHALIRPTIFALAALSSTSRPSAFATALPTQKLDRTSLRQSPLRIATATLTKSTPVMPVSGSGQSQCVTTPTLSPPAGPLSRKTLASRYQYQTLTGGDRLALSLTDV